MDITQLQEQLLEFFKAMANQERIRIAAALMQRPYTLAELAEMLGAKAAEVLEHLATLRQIGLVSTDASMPTRYSFDEKALFAMNRTMLSREDQSTPVDSIEDAAVRKTLRQFFMDDKLINLPENPKKFALLVEWLATCFEQGVKYPEQQVNAIIMRYHEDYATLRRAMIDAQLMQRENGIYWRLGVGAE